MSTPLFTTTDEIILDNYKIKNITNTLAKHLSIKHSIPISIFTPN